MFFVFGDVTGDRFVAQLRQFDAQFFRCDEVEAISDHGPVTSTWRTPRCGSFNGGAFRQGGRHGLGHRSKTLKSFLLFNLINIDIGEEVNYLFGQ